MSSLYITSNYGDPNVIEIIVISNDKYGIYHKETDINVLENFWGEVNHPEFVELSSDISEVNIYIRWFSIIYKKCYESTIFIDKINASNNYTIGIAYDLLVIWSGSEAKKEVISLFKGEPINIADENITPWNPFVTYSAYSELHKKYSDLCGFKIEYMQQFTYRYILQFEKWNDSSKDWLKYEENEDSVPKFEFIEESLFNGTFDKLHDDGLLKYHEAGKPKKLAIKWHINKSEYTAYFWFEDEKICSIFERFYGAHPDTKTDFIIRIDSEKKKYELALFRQGLKEPQIIPEDAYQLLVFKNKFEDYRSDNYNQERGAWIW